ncbi:MAG: response regulator, partial [Chloroflexi bacterium]|nr:response regulator [Chloroflexota bacterium]
MLSEGARVLAVDDVPANVEVLESMLTPYGYDVTGALSANEALESISARLPDIVLVDVVMPGVDGLELCRTLRADPSTRFLPIILITAGGERQRVQGLTAGADDFLVKPIDRGELLARVRSLVRIKDYHDTMQRQADELAAWNRRLETRVQEQVEQLQRLGRLRQFLSPQVADLLISTEGETLLETHRRQIAVVSCSLPGFRALAETSAPEEVVGLLSEYYLAVGNISFGYS